MHVIQKYFQNQPFYVIRFRSISNDEVEFYFVYFKATDKVNPILLVEHLIEEIFLIIKRLIAQISFGPGDCHEL